MDYGHRRNRSLANVVFRSFVCVTLTLLLGSHFYLNFWGPWPDTLDGDFSDIKYVVMQLTRGLTEVNTKHERLKNEMQRISEVLPAFVEATGRAKEALSEPARRGKAIGDLIDYDRQMADFALESAGAKILDTGDTVEYINNYDSRVTWALHLVTAFMCRECLSARAVIRPGSHPGECWAFKGSRGEVTILLLGTVKIKGVSLEHIPAHIAPTREISAAPRLFQIEGLDYRHDPYPHDYGSYEYEKDGKPNQYFEVKNPSSKGHNIVRLRVMSNWGNPVYTCVYRIRVHGDLVPGQGHAISSDDTDMRIENE